MSLNFYIPIQYSGTSDFLNERVYPPSHNWNKGILGVKSGKRSNLQLMLNQQLLMMGLTYLIYIIFVAYRNCLVITATTLWA